ncbi:MULTISPECIES: hypothetical protein [unclassified Nonlabens]|uniref:hypothetical protein n=1 Tax=unclassified Nonlabens TaxID=2615035 RepID=UPI00386802EA
MRIFLKILSFVLLIVLTTISGWQFRKELSKSQNFGDKYIGLNKEQIIAEFGKPDYLNQKLVTEYDDDFKHFFKDIYCEANTKILYLKYEKIWFTYEFWLVNNDNSEIVLLVK